MYIIFRDETKKQKRKKCTANAALMVSFAHVYLMQYKLFPQKLYIWNKLNLRIQWIHFIVCFQLIKSIFYHLLNLVWNMCLFVKVYHFVYIFVENHFDEWLFANIKSHNYWITTTKNHIKFSAYIIFSFNWSYTIR